MKVTDCVVPNCRNLMAANECVNSNLICKGRLNARGEGQNVRGVNKGRINRMAYLEQCDLLSGSGQGLMHLVHELVISGRYPGYVLRRDKSSTYSDYLLTA